MIITVLFYTFVASAAVQVIYFLCFSSVIFTKNQKKEDVNIPISVIICAKNEAKNLQEFLPKIINQNYPNFEIILINDASTDTTLEIMEAFKELHSKIKIVNVKNNEAFWGNKKYALTLGIKTATNKHLLFTDADCKPVSDLWIQQMANQFSNNKSIVLGYGKYKMKSSFVNLLVRFETLLTALQYFTYAKLGSPYMGVGRNLAYTKDNFFKTNGYINHIQLKSGDDDLFIQEAATKSNTTIAINQDSFTESIPPTTFKDWFRQKRRHVSTASYYKFKHKLFLGMFYVTKLTFYSLIIPLFLLTSWKVMILISAIYFILLYLIYGSATKHLQEKKLVFFLPFLEVFLLLFQFTIFISNTISKPTHWK